MKGSRKLEMSTTASDDDLLEQVLYAYENDVVPEKSIFQFQQNGLGPSLQGRRYQLNPVPLYYRNPKCCCNVKLTICLSLILAVVATIILLIILFFAGGIADPVDVSLKPSADTANLTQEHYALMDAVVGMGRNKLGKKVTANTEAPVFASTSDSQCAYIRCHLFAKCQDGLCRCYSGYEEDRMGQCVPTQACRKATRACGCNSVCVGLAGHLSCMCKNGYEKIVGSLRCFDINECQREEFQCPKSAYCFNVSGGYRCLCKAGYTASFTEDGLVCAPGMVSDAGNTLSNYTQSSVKI